MTKVGGDFAKFFGLLRIYELYHTLYQKTIAKVTNDADFLQELESQHRPKRFMPGLVTMVVLGRSVLGPPHTLELKQKYL